jgi:hypothetical protein
VGFVEEIGFDSHSPDVAKMPFLGKGTIRTMYRHLMLLALLLGASIHWKEFLRKVNLFLCVLRLVLQAKGWFYHIYDIEWVVSYFPHLEEIVQSWMVRGSDASNSGNTPDTDGWNSFDERVLLEPTPDSSSSSVNGPSQTEAADTAQTSEDPNRDPEELLKKKDELHTLVREQLRHYCERGRPKWQLSSPASEEQKAIFADSANHIISDLEIGATVSEHQYWIDHLRSNPTALYDLFKDFK